MANVLGGYQPDTRSESSRRADFDLRRRIARDGSAGEPSGPNPNNALGVIAEAAKVSADLLASPNMSHSLFQTLSVRLVAGRKYRAACQLRAAGGPTANNTYRLELMDNTGGEHLIGGDIWANTAYVNPGFSAEWRLDGDDVDHQLWVKATTYSANVGNTTYYVSSGASYFYIEDVGPNAPPSLPIPETPPAWTALTFTNGWQNYAVDQMPAAYRKIGDVVTLRGLVSRPSGDSGLAITTLPVGFRPPANVVNTVATFATGGVVRLDINASGAVAPANVPGIGGFVSLAQLSFSTTL